MYRDFNISQEIPRIRSPATPTPPSLWGYELGCTDWIHKPFCRQELIARVKAERKVWRDENVGFVLVEGFFSISKKENGEKW